MHFRNFLLCVVATISVLAHSTCVSLNELPDKFRELRQASYSALTASNAPFTGSYNLMPNLHNSADAEELVVYSLGSIIDNSPLPASFRLEPLENPILIREYDEAQYLPLSNPHLVDTLRRAENLARERSISSLEVTPIGPSQVTAGLPADSQLNIDVLHTDIEQARRVLRRESAEANVRRLLSSDAPITRLGSGGSSEVFQAAINNTDNIPIDVAIKVEHPLGTFTIDEMREFLRIEDELDDYLSGLLPHITINRGSGQVPVARMARVPDNIPEETLDTFRRNGMSVQELLPGHSAKEIERAIIHDSEANPVNWSVFGFSSRDEAISELRSLQEVYRLTHTDVTDMAMRRSPGVRLRISNIIGDDVAASGPNVIWVGGRRLLSPGIDFNGGRNAKWDRVARQWVIFDI